jgi:hypothetical protein
MCIAEAFSAVVYFCDVAQVALVHKVYLAKFGDIQTCERRKS